MNTGRGYKETTLFLRLWWCHYLRRGSEKLASDHGVEDNDGAVKLSDDYLICYSEITKQVDVTCYFIRREKVGDDAIRRFTFRLRSR